MTAEAVIDPTQRICDPHHHLWDDARQRYLVEEFLADVGDGHRIDSTVYVECLREYRSDGPKELRPVGETEFVHQHTQDTQDDATRVAAGIVGFADLTLGSAVGPVLLAHKEASDRFRGIRYATAKHDDASIHPAHTDPPPGLLGDSTFRHGIRQLDRFNLVFDAWLYFPQLGELEDLARACSDIRIVLNHVGGPIGIGRYADRRAEVFASWRQSMRTLSRCDNVFVKLGGLAMKLSGFGWHKRDNPVSSAELAAAWKPYFDTCIEYFGYGRCMFESNFPVDRVSCSYTVLWNAFKRCVRDASDAERDAVLYGTATRVYGLEAEAS